MGQACSCNYSCHHEVFCSHMSAFTAVNPERTLKMSDAIEILKHVKGLLSRASLNKCSLYATCVVAQYVYTLPTDQTIHNGIPSKVCCDGFTFGIRKTCNNQHNILLWITIWTMLITESHAVSQLFLKLSFIIAFYHESLKISYSVGLAMTYNNEEKQSFLITMVLQK